MTDPTKTALSTRIDMVEKELAELKMKQAGAKSTHQLTLRGMWKGIDVTDEDIEEAKRSLFREIDDI